jgi:4-hydroxy-2-oxoheptanedioate aldolase
MKTNWVRAAVRGGQPTVGCFSGLGSPAVVELLAQAGFDWLVIETEHNAVDLVQVEHMLRAVSGTDTIPLVRVPSHDPMHIQRALDIGAYGVVVPMVRTAAEAERIVRATRYPPVGSRSWGPLRASAYTFDNVDYMERANEEILVVLIVETREAVENLGAIAAVPGVDALFLGKWDMSLALGLNPIHLPFPEIDAIFDRMRCVCGSCGIGAGTGAGSPEELQALLAAGYTFLSYSTDYSLLANAARAGLRARER